jgi:putative membrane protein
MSDCGPGFREIFAMLVLFIILVCVLIYYFARTTPGGENWRPGWGDPSRSALQILNERFAKGEIQKEEYEERKATLLAGARRDQPRQ